jgi:DNA-binding HxlR family transcriptional regulator
MSRLPQIESMGELCDSQGGVVVRDMFERIGDKWTLLVVGMLDSGPQRFTALRQSVPGISQRMLTLTLRHLERDGLVSRTAFAEVPPRVEYALTPLGSELLPAVTSLAKWALDNEQLIHANRELYDAS